MTRLTEQEGIAVYKVHHIGEAKTVDQAAREMGVHPCTLRQLLKSAEEKLPGWFPILTQHQAEILHLYSVEGLSPAQIAMTRGVTARAIRHTIKRLRECGALCDDRPGRPVSFNEVTMSDKVVSRW